jgi:hypothetical protein|tara:strand:- start:2319 stop:2696 length:378 start_codon:yes stop_codon:yes gene_type:complete
MSKYYVNKFLFTVDRDPKLLAQYKSDPAGLVAMWEKEIGPALGQGGNAVEFTTVHSLTDEERRALVEHDYVALFEMGAHFFLNLTIMIALYDEEFMKRSGPLSFQIEMAKKLSHWKGREYPSIQI